MRVHHHLSVWLIFWVVHRSTEQLSQQLRACGAAERNSVLLRCTAAVQKNPAQRSMGIACTSQASSVLHEQKCAPHRRSPMYAFAVL